MKLAVRADLRLEGGLRPGDIAIIDAVAGEGRTQHTALEIGEVPIAHWHLEVALGLLDQCTCAKRVVLRGSRCVALHVFADESADRVVMRGVMGRIRELAVAVRSIMCRARHAD